MSAEDIMIKKAEYMDLGLISLLMHTVFMTKMQSHYGEEGKKSFLEQIELASLQKRFLQGNVFYISENMTAVLEVEAPCHIAFLFVQEEEQGFGKALLSQALKDTAQDICTVGAFEEAIGFYRKVGFKTISDEKIFHGMAFTLMAKHLS